MYNGTVEIRNMFNEHSKEKTYCVLGVLCTDAGLQIEQEMLQWLVDVYDVICVRQQAPGKLFEYPALKYAQELSIKTQENILYLHTKGAFYERETQSHVRNFWRIEFTYHLHEYLTMLNSKTPIVVCPFTGVAKTTWYNGFFINPLAANELGRIISTSNRYYYETMFAKKNNIKVIGRLFNNVDDKPVEGKNKAKKYVSDLYMSNGKKYLETPNTLCLLFPSHKSEHNGSYDNLKNEMIKKGNAFIDFRDFDFKRYSTYKCNEHHFTTDTHFNIFLPEICNKLNIEYSLDDFEKVNFKSKEGFDLSYYKPKQDFEFSININGTITKGSFDVLLGHNKHFPNQYHELFASSHTSCFIENLSIHNGKHLLISGDSHNVPILPFLSCFFESITYLDNRDRRGMNVEPSIPSKIDYTQREYTDIVFSFFEANSPEKYIFENFKYEDVKKKVVYTCITGEYDILTKPNKILKDWDYVCFTDNLKMQTHGVWKLRPIPSDIQTYSKVKQQRCVKIMTHKFLPEYDLSIWVDGSVLIKGDMNKLIGTYCQDGNIFVPKHPARDCIYKEAKECLKLKKDTWENMGRQMERFKKEGFPEHYGLLQSNIMVRKHNADDCKKLMETWWGVLKDGSHRDQLSFNYALWKNQGTKVIYLDKFIYKSEYFLWDGKHAINEKNIDKTVQPKGKIVVKTDISKPQPKIYSSPVTEGPIIQYSNNERANIPSAVRKTVPQRNAINKLRNLFNG